MRRRPLFFSSFRPPNSPRPHLRPPIPPSRSLTLSSPSHHAPALSPSPSLDLDLVPPIPIPISRPTTETERPAFRLRPYQADCVQSCLKAIVEEGYSRVAVSAPTGSGKTAIFTSLLKVLPPLLHPSQLATRVLIIVGSIELATQAYSSVSSIWPHLTVELEQSSYRASGEADVTIATYQTLSYKDYTRLQKFDPGKFKAVIVDEAHHAAARTYLGILSYFDSRIATSLSTSSISETTPLNPSPILLSSTVPSNHNDHEVKEAPPIPATIDSFGRTCVPILGFSATLSRADGLSLGKVFEKIAWYGDWLDFIEAGWLSPLRFTTVKLGDALDIESVTVSNSTGDFVIKSLATAVEREAVVDLVVDAWFTKAWNCKSTLVFGVTVAHVFQLANAFRERGIDARLIHEGTPAQERKEILAAFKKCEIPVLVNCAILTEGADFPAIDCVVLARPTKSPNLYTQMIGRGLRKSPETGKESCLILDIVGNSTRGVFNAPTLFGLDPDAEVEEQSTTEMTQAATERTRSESPLLPQLDPSEHEIEYRDYATVFDLLKSSEKSQTHPGFISSLSRNCWLGCGNGTFVLELGGRKSVKVVTKEEGGRELYEAHLHRLVDYGGRFYAGAPENIGRHHDLRTLLRTADAYLKANPGLSSFALRRNAAWRSAPATDAQKNSIRSKLLKDDLSGADALSGPWLGRRWDETIRVEHLTKGNAADIITRMYNGGLAIFKKLEKKHERESRKTMKMAQKELANAEERREKEQAKEAARLERERIQFEHILEKWQ